MTAVRELVLTPPCRFINSNDRLHHQPKARLTKKWRDAGLAAALTSDLARVDRAHITMTIRFADNIRRDVGNFYPTAKAILDGIVESGRSITDDSDEFIIGPDMRRDYPNGPPRVTVRIEALAMNTPYDDRTVNYTDTDRAAWARYEAESRAANAQYKTIPIAFRHANTVHKKTCIHECGRRTEARDGVCRTCRRGDPWPDVAAVEARAAARPRPPFSNTPPF